MQIALSRFFRPRTPVVPEAFLGLNPAAAPAGPGEQTLCRLLEREGPMRRDRLVAALAGEIHRELRETPAAATLDVGLWGAAVAHAEADRLVRRTAGRLLVGV
jgi:hypothetical protein